jgi:putative transposase
VVGIFPNAAALLRLTTAVLVEQDDEWQDGRRHFSQQSMAQLLAAPPALPTNPFLEDLAA